MANKSLFNKANPAVKVPETDTVNEAGGKAYAFGPEHALAQLAATGCLNNTFYGTGEAQLDSVLDLANKVSPKFVAQTAIYARERGYMKDMPALLCAVLAKRDSQLLKTIFPRVIDNGKMLRNFVQIIRSGKTGKKSLASAPKGLVRDWLESRDDRRLLEASIGNEPSLADIIKMAHPKPKNPSRSAFYGYLLDKEYDKRKLPEIVKQYEAYKAGDSTDVPDVPFQLLTALKLGKREWTQIAKDMKWHATRINLNTMQRHGVFEDQKMVRLIADRLRDEEQIAKVKVFPYQLLAAFLNVDGVPPDITEALQDAMEISLKNVPEIAGRVWVFPDVSGSMSSPITGARGSATSKVRCIDIAALVAAAFLRQNKTSGIIPFEGGICPIAINPRDSVMTNAKKLASIGGGSTNCSAPLAELNRKGESGDLIVYVSDNESWVDSNRYRYGGTGTMQQWELFKRRNPKAKMVCIDIQANASTQAQENKDIMNVGGFSDDVFTLIEEFYTGRLGSDHWVGEIQKISLRG